MGRASQFNLIDTLPVERGVESLGTDLATGAWDSRYGDLRTRDSMDLGYVLIVAELSDA